FVGEAVPQPNENDFGVGSPIRSDRIVHMTDEHWLSAIQHYSSGSGSGTSQTGFHATAGGLAGELAVMTKKDPTRFARLIARIPVEADPVFVERILVTLLEVNALEDEILKAALTDAHRLNQHAVWICRLIS